MNDDGNQINKYHSVNFTGRQLDASLAPVSGQDMGSDATLANASLNKATYEKTENKTAATLKPDNKSADFIKEQVGRNITSGPVIIPPPATNTTPSSNTTSDAVIIPPRDEQQVSVPPAANTTPSSNTTSDAAATIPARDEQQQQQDTTSFTSPYSTIEEPSTMISTIDTNSTSAAADVDNSTSGSVFIPSQEPQQRRQQVDQHSTPFCPSQQASGSTSNTASSQTQTNLVFQHSNENSETDDIRPGDIPLVLPTPQVKDQTDLEEGSTFPPSPPSAPSSGNESSSSHIIKNENNSSPIIKIENNNTKVSEGFIASLNATKSCIFNGPTAAASYEWKPLITNATTLPPVEILGELSSPVLRFKAPNVSQDTLLQFELVLSDSQGNTQTEVGQVIVEDVPINPDMGNENNQSKVRIPSDAQFAVEGPGVPSNVRIPNVNVTSSESKADNSSSGGKGTEPIMVKAGVNQIVNEGMAVSLEGNAVGPGATQNLKYEWTQIGGDPQVEFEESSSAKQITFRAPDVDEDSLLTFGLSVVSTEEEEQAFSDDVTVMIRNIPEPSDDGEDDDESDEDGNDDDNDDN